METKKYNSYYKRKTKYYLRKDQLKEAEKRAKIKKRIEELEEKLREKKIDNGLYD